MMNFDAEQHLLVLNGRRQVVPKLLFEGKVIPYPSDPRISMVAGFPEACTYVLGQEAKWAQTKTTMKTHLRETREELEEKRKVVGKEVEVAEQKFQRGPTTETIKELDAAKTKLERIDTKTQEVQREKKHIENLGKRQATVFGIGNTVHEHIRTKTRKELLEEKKVFLVEGPRDWFRIEEKLSQGFTIVCSEFPLYLTYKGLIITGHPDNFTLTPNLVLDVEEWKTSKTGKRDPKYDTQATLYSLALKEIFGTKEASYTVRVWNKSDYPLEGKGLLTRLKTGETTVPASPHISYTTPLNGRSKEIDNILDYTYNLFTAQIPCVPVTSGLCQNWCSLRFKCPEFQGMRQFVENFKVEVPNGN